MKKFILLLGLCITQLGSAGELAPGKAIIATFQFECFSMPRVPARRAFLNHPKPADLYHWLVAESEKDKSAVKLENLSIIRTNPGQRAMIKSVADLISSTNPGPPHIPQSLIVKPTNDQAAPTSVTPPTAEEKTKEKTKGNQGDVGLPGPATEPKKYPFPYIPSTPLDFEVTETGWTFEVDSVLGEANKTIEVNVNPKFLKFERKVSYDKNRETWQPIFRSQQLNAGISCKIDEPTLIGTLNPAPETGLEMEGLKNQVWFLYVTVTLQNP